MSLMALLGVLIICLALAGFAGWLIRNFCKAEWQKYAWAVMGLVVLIVFIWIVSALTGASVPFVRIGH